jgi:hypothetical protein
MVNRTKVRKEPPLGVGSAYVEVKSKRPRLQSTKQELCFERKRSVHATLSGRHTCVSAPAKQGAHAGAPRWRGFVIRAVQRTGYKPARAKE